MRLIQRPQLERAIEHLRAFALEQNLAGGRLDLAQLVHQTAIDPHANLVAAAVTVDLRPLVARAFHVAGAAEIELVAPLRVLVAPIEPPAVVEDEPPAAWLPGRPAFGVIIRG